MLQTDLKVGGETFKRKVIDQKYFFLKNDFDLRFRVFEMQFIFLNFFSLSAVIMKKLVSFYMFAVKKIKKCYSGFDPMPLNRQT